MNYSNNNNINFTQLNVNYNIEINSLTERNFDKMHNDPQTKKKNREMIEKLVVLKRSVDKYSEEANKKINFSKDNFLNNMTNNSNALLSHRNTERNLSVNKRFFIKKLKPGILEPLESNSTRNFKR